MPNTLDVSKCMFISGGGWVHDCQPIKRACIKHWQTSTAGKYTDALRAYLLTGDDGSFEFETEWPDAPIPHIQIIISAEGYSPVATQWLGDEIVSRIEL